MERRGLLLALVLGSIFCVPGPVVAQDDSGSPDLSAQVRRKANLAFDFSIAGRYDDNILHLSECDRESVDAGIPRLRCAADPRHRASHAAGRIESSDDNVILGDFQVRWTTRPFPHRNTIVSAASDIYRYSRNPVKNWSEWSVALAQELSASRRHLTAVRASVAYVPSFYLRELRDDGASFAAGMPIYASATYSQTEYDLSGEQEIVNNRLNAMAGGELQSRNYNLHFDERDGDRTTWSLGLRGRPFERSRSQATLSYAWGRLAARGDLGSTPIVERDISYDHHEVKLDVAIHWGDHRRGRVELLAMKETRDFTTSDRFDIFRFGRVDRRREYRGRIVQRVARRLDVLVEWWRYKNDPDLLIASIDPSGDITGFVENRYTVGLRLHVSTK